MTEKVDREIQTTIDLFEFDKITKNHESVLYYKNLNFNLLTDSIEKIKYNCTEVKLIPKTDLLSYIYEIYCEKISTDVKNSGLGPNHQAKFNDIIYNLLKSKFKLRSDVKQRCEEIILSVVKYKSKHFIFI